VVAKARQVSSPTFVRRFKSSHSSAQARILARLARGSDGGGFVVSRGASGGSLVGLSTLGAGSAAGGFGVGLTGGFGAADCLAVGFAGAGFVVFGLVGDAGEGAVCACAGAGAMRSAPATQPATSPENDDAVLSATAMFYLIPA
jgi:hypothetical protein